MTQAVAEEIEQMKAALKEQEINAKREASEMSAALEKAKVGVLYRGHPFLVHQPHSF